jgi:salicylate hydroxylase
MHSTHNDPYSPQPPFPASPHNRIDPSAPHAPTEVHPTPGCSQPFSIALVGGGIGGLCLARSLLRNSVPFHVYEAATAFAEIGAGVAFSPNSRRAMTLIDPAVHAGFVKGSTANQSASRQDTWFEFRMGMDGRTGTPTAHLAAGDKFAERNGPQAGVQSVHRAHFLDELVKLVPAENVTFGKKAQRVEDRGADGVRIYFEDGSVVEHSAVVGCDGVKSHVRDSLLGPEKGAVFTGKYAYRGLLDMDRAAQLLGDEVARNSQMHVGYHGHVLTFPIEKGRVMNVVAFQTKDDGRWENEKWVVPMDRRDMEADFAEWGPVVKKILSLMEKPDVWALFDHPPADTYYKGRVCLMGDAAHASTPHQGAGAGMAIEDAYVLGAVLGLVKDSRELEAAFSAYDAVRRQRSLDLVTTSRDAGHQWEFEAEGVEDDLEKFQKRLDERLDWIWNEDLSKEFNEAKGLFEQTKSKL